MFDPSRYPPNWRTEIRPRILARDGYQCAFCGLADQLVGWRFPSGNFYTAEQLAGDYMPKEDEAVKKEVLEQKPNGMKIRLTVAHLDHGLSDHGDENLTSLCQRCHLNYDRPYCFAKRKQTMHYGKRKGQISLQFDSNEIHQF